MKMKSVMSHSFSDVPKIDIPRSRFDRSHGFKTSFDAGKLIPFYVDEVLPGDTFNVQSTIFARLATPIVPVMDNVFLDVHYFAVPLRLIWDNFQKMMGEQVDPGDSIDYLVPQMTTLSGESWQVGDLADYFGLPVQVADLSVSALPFRAYNLIWNEWYRDQNLQDSVVVDRDDVTVDNSNYIVLPRNKRHDYFTSALPWPQKGAGVELPLGDTAPVFGVANQQMQVYDSALRSIITDANGVLNTGTPQANIPVYIPTEAQNSTNFMEVDLSSATASTINSLREAFQLQRMLEKDARGGTRYTEIIKSHFGVTSPDARLQRPEFLGGGTFRLDMQQVPQTSSTDATTPQGNLSAYGMAIDRDSGFTKSFTEHCLIIGLISARADLTYQQGIPRMFSRRTRYDFYWPSLAHLGEQEVLNKEIYAQGTSADDEVFGYQERYAEYRYFPSQITGKLRSVYPTPLDYWHLSQEFSSLPALNDTFIREEPPMSRILAVPSEPHFIMDSYISAKCVRPMPVYSVPGMIDHF